MQQVPRPQTLTPGVSLGRAFRLVLQVISNAMAALKKVLTLAEGAQSCGYIAWSAALSIRHLPLGISGVERGLSLWGAKQQGAGLPHN